MRIAVTGGTGYLGAHTVRALLEKGHDVRLLVAPGCENEPVIRHLQELGDLSVMGGDVRDTAVIGELLDGRDAVLHAAGIVGTDESRAQLMWEINAYATENVLKQAVALGLDPIVSVSSYSALFPPPEGNLITPDTPPAPGRSAYAKTKGYADRIARDLQASGAPVVVTYPSSVVGPAFHTAPGVTESGWAPILRFGVAPTVRGGMQMVDVRDVADVHAALMTPGRGPHRYICGGQMVQFDEMISAIERSGRKVRRIPLSPAIFRGIGRIADRLGSVVSLGDGFSYEAALLLTSATPTDDSSTLRDLDITWRSPTDAIVESIKSESAI